MSGCTIGPVDLFRRDTSTAASSARSAPIVVVSTSSKELPSGTATNVEETSKESTSGGNEATTIDIGTGLGVGLPLLAGLAVALFFLRRMRNQSKRQWTRSE